MILPVYNAAATIEQAIQSVLAQDWELWELLIVDDGSQDNTEQIVSNFSDNRLFYFHQENMGVSTARNKALEQMRGEFFCFLDADDALTPKSLSSRLQIFNQNPDVTFVDGQVCIMDENLEEKLETRIQTFEGSPFKALLAVDNSCFFGITWMIRRNPVRKYNFKPDLTHGEDLLFYLSLSQYGGIYTATEEPIYCCRSGNASAMGNLDGLWFGYQAVYKELRDHFSLDQQQLAMFKNKITCIMFKSFLGHYQPMAAIRAVFDYFRL